MLKFNIIKHEEILSTQDEAKNICPSIDEGTVVFSEAQSKGRGKPGSVWHSPLGGLYFSIILKPKMDIIDLLPITRLAAEAVVSLLLSYGIEAGIKLPNDVIVRNKKICGILVEKTKNALIVGIGINVNISEFPNGLNAVSMQIIKNKTFDAEKVLSDYLKAFNYKYSKFIKDSVESI